MGMSDGLTVLVRKGPNGEAQPCLISAVDYAIQNGYSVIDQKELDQLRSGMKFEAVIGETLGPETTEDQGPVAPPLPPTPVVVVTVKAESKGGVKIIPTRGI